VASKLVGEAWTGTKTGASRWRRAQLVAALALAAGSMAACSSTQSAAPPTTSTTVENHVHAIVNLASDSQILLGTHYGLRVSMDGGRTWTDDPGLGRIMVAKLVKLGSNYVAALQPMAGMGGGSSSSGSTPQSSARSSSKSSGPSASSMSGASGSGMSMSGASGSGMSMSGASGSNLYAQGNPAIPFIEVSSNGFNWRPATGVPSQALIGYLTPGPVGTGAWAAVLGSGIYHSNPSGTKWSLAVPYSGIVTGLEAGVGDPNRILVATKSGLFAAATTAKSLPSKPVLADDVESLHRWYSCSACLVASLANGGVALSRDGGTTWSKVGSLLQFDTVESFPSTGADLFAMIATSGSSYVGVYRSSDGGNVWTRVLNQQLVDHISEVDPAGSQPYLLAYQWGITVWRSTDGGRTWSRFSHA
jgi:hypothetical protein